MIINKRKIILIVLISFCLIIGLQTISAENTNIINVNGHNLIISDNYTIVSGNNTDTVIVNDSQGEIYAITCEDTSSYYGINNGFSMVDTGDYNVTGIYCEDADMDSACILDDNGTCILIDHIDTNNNDNFNPNSTYQLGSTLQVLNNLVKADFNLLSMDKDTGVSDYQSNIKSDYNKAKVSNDYPISNITSNNTVNNNEVPDLEWDL